MRPWNPKLKVDGVEYEIPWDDVNIGDSFFLPCVNTPEVVDRLRVKIKHLRWEMTYDVRVEAGKWGIRFWRTL